jgi:hypothetical protein
LVADLRTLAGIGGPVIRLAEDRVEQLDAKPAVLWLDSQNADSNPEADRLATTGKVVQVLHAQPWPPGAESAKSPYLGIFNLLSLRAFLVGKTILGIRTEEAIAAVEALHKRPDVSETDLTIYGKGAMGMVALAAAVLDPHVTRIVIENSLSSYRSIIDVPLHRDVSEVVIPGVLKSFDVADLMRALGTRPVVVINPLDGAGDPVPEAEFRKALGAARNVSIRTNPVW